MTRFIYITHFIIVLLFSPHVFAQNIGDACSNANQILRERGVGANTGIVCDGSNYVAFKSYDTAPLRNGIGTTTPAVTLDINGEVKIGNTSLACSTTTEGALRYNTTDKNIEICDGTDWGAIRASACDNSPAFPTFSSLSAQTTSTLVTSNIVAITGMDVGCSASVGISGSGSPEYRTCSDSGCASVVQAWTAANNTLDIQGGYIQLRATTSASLETAFTITLNAGGVSSDWVITTGLTDCAPIGSVCADGSVYAGLSAGSVPMYVTRCDAGQTWGGASCDGAAVTYNWNSGSSTTYTTTGITSTSDGDANTASLITIDASTAAGFQDHNAAKFCSNLVMHGKSDWYLPARDELNTIYLNNAVIGNFDLSGQYYWSSTETATQDASFQRFSDGNQTGSSRKYLLELVRCARR